MGTGLGKYRSRSWQKKTETEFRARETVQSSTLLVSELVPNADIRALLESLAFGNYHLLLTPPRRSNTVCPPSRGGDLPRRAARLSLILGAFALSIFASRGSWKPTHLTLPFIRTRICSLPGNDVIVGYVDKHRVCDRSPCLSGFQEQLQLMNRFRVVP